MSAIVGESSPRPAGWVTQPLRIQLRLLTFQFSCLPVDLSPLWGFVVFGACRVLYTCRPSGALGYLVHVACYKHAAPLGLKQAPVPLLPDGLGNPTPTASPFRYVVLAACLGRCVVALNIPHVLCIAHCVSL